jgi:hypothetical protein
MIKLSPKTTNDKGHSLDDILNTRVKIINRPRKEPAIYTNIIFRENMATVKKLIPTVPRKTGHNDTRFFQEVAFK